MSPRTGNALHEDDTTDDEDFKGLGCIERVSSLADQLEDGPAAGTAFTGMIFIARSSSTLVFPGIRTGDGRHNGSLLPPASPMLPLDDPGSRPRSLRPLVPSSDIVERLCTLLLPVREST